MARIALNDAPSFLPPPIAGGGCGRFGTPTDYNNPACCVSGYVYVDGQPVAGAIVTISTHARTRTVSTAVDPNNTTTLQPFFTVSLDAKPLDARPGDIVTITATYNGQSKTAQFVANAGGQQIDVVMPQVDSTWLAANVGGRHDHALAYDATRQQVVLFGGTTARNEVLAETWIWDGGQWTERRPPNAPPPRYGHALVYDDVRQQTVLFGGQAQNGAYFQDTWVWNSANWLERISAAAIPARMFHAMAYDEARQRIVLFGGNNGGGSLGDTWEWDGVTWNEIKPPVAPSKRLRHAMVYDAAHQRVLLFGGQAAIEHPEQKFADLWAWDGNHWTQIHPSLAPPTLAGHTLAYDSLRQRVVLFGGQTASGEESNMVWEWDGATWLRMTPDHAPPARSAQSMVYDDARQQSILFGGVAQHGLLQPLDLADTWGWDGTRWREKAPVAPFARWRDVAAAYEHAGRILVFGGLSGQGLLGSPQADTFRWQPGQWERLTPATIPPARYGHRLARNQNGSRFLLFGGLGEEQIYLDDTWVWDGGNWTSYQPALHPTPRAYYSLTYDVGRGLWILFGGEGNSGTFNDTWEFNGKDWLPREVAPQPPSRRRATLTYDPIHKRSLLFGGRTDTTFYNDLWAWDGTTWTAITPLLTPPARAGHGATYDPVQQVVVIAGGTGEHDRLTGTWNWDGTNWQLRSTAPVLPRLYSVQMDYDDIHQQIAALGEREGGNLAGEGIWLHKAFTVPHNVAPIATIQHINKSDVTQDIDVLTWIGRGADGDASDHLIGYRWRHNDLVIGVSNTLSISASQLPAGLQTLDFTVQDDEGDWSAPVQKSVWVRQPNGSVPVKTPTWTLLIYVAGDNNLALHLDDNSVMNGLLYRLRTAGPQPNVQVGVLFDGDGADDTRRYILRENGASQGETLPEADMGQMETLRDFIRWGYTKFASDYTMLALVGHSNGVVGFGKDYHPATGANSEQKDFTFLSPIALRTALQAAADDGNRKLDVLYVDGPSFGLLEDASIVDGLVNFMIVSANTGWGVFPYEVYRSLASGISNDPRSFAQAIAKYYADTSGNKRLPYTISVFDMAHFQALRNAVGQLGDSLKAYLQTDEAGHVSELDNLRNQMQKYDSSGNRPVEIDSEDLYIDLFDLAMTLKNKIAAPDVQVATNTVATRINAFVIVQKQASGQFRFLGNTVDIEFKEQLGGIGIYYPLRIAPQPENIHAAYIENRLFPITAGWGWKNFIVYSLNVSELEDPPPIVDNVLLKPLFDEDRERVYLSLVVR